MLIPELYSDISDITDDFGVNITGDDNRIRGLKHVKECDRLNTGLRLVGYKFCYKPATIKKVEGLRAGDVGSHHWLLFGEYQFNS